ncbi:hypothetical protein B0T20DRAFT_236727 [Sordaria brevicollis]|uniref:Uncharacterized protein n=1 Tax=Sordaria brevicollis TaxID=83679 RepID=A0AAE0UBT7_SORBR|nr:hypothetical protein B0T20DRAFT_236727 [Sordaria brevicollis]
MLLAQARLRMPRAKVVRTTAGEMELWTRLLGGELFWKSPSPPNSSLAHDEQGRRQRSGKLSCKVRGGLCMEGEVKVSLILQFPRVPANDNTTLQAKTPLLVPVRPYLLQNLFSATSPASYPPTPIAHHHQVARSFVSSILLLPASGPFLLKNWHFRSRRSSFPIFGGFDSCFWPFSSSHPAPACAECSAYTVPCVAVHHPSLASFVGTQSLAKRSAISTSASSRQSNQK